MKILVLGLALTTGCMAWASDPWELSQNMQESVDELSATTDPLRALYLDFLYRSASDLVTTYHWPTPERANQLLALARESVGERFGSENVPDVGVRTLLKSTDDVMRDFRVNFPRKFLYFRRKLASQYIRAVRQSDLQKQFRTPPSTPSSELFYLAAVKGKTNGGPDLLMEVVQGRLTQAHFEDLWQPDRPSPTRTGPFPQPLIFADGLREIHQLALFDAPFAFTGFVDRERVVTKERAMRTLSAIEESKGFIAVSWTSGKPVNTLWLETLFEIAQRNDLVILVGATQNNWDGFPEELLNIPRLHLVTHDLENRSLKISTEPINPDIEDPIPEARKPGRLHPGQTIVLFHPHQRLEIVPSGSNTLAPVMIVATGSLNEPFASYPTLAQGRRKLKAKAFHKLKAFVFEKSDGLASQDPDGARNQWHPLPLTFYDDLQFGHGAGTIYRSRAYEFRATGEERTLRFLTHKIDPRIWYLGDKHVPHTDPEVVHAMLTDLELDVDSHVIFQSGDTFDLSVISHWSDDKKVELNQKFQRGEILLKDQVNAVIDTINALLQRFPNARYRMIVGNHDEWLTRLLDRTPDYQAMINGDILDEFSFVVKNLGWDIWDYIFHRREGFWKSILSENPAQRREILQRLHPVYAQERIEIVRRGEDLMEGPPHRKNDVARHGDRANFGMKRPTLKAHALGMPEGGGIVGDSHRPGIYGEVFDVGTFSPVDPAYGRGFLSGVGQAMAPLYENGIKEFWMYNRQAHGFRPRDPAHVPKGRAFFGDDPLKIRANDNDFVDKHKEVERMLATLDCMRRLVVP